MQKLFEKIIDGQWTLLCNNKRSGLPHIQYLYAGYWRDDETGEIDLEKARREVPKLADRLENDLLCIDVEGPQWTDRLTSWGSNEVKWQEGLNRLGELVEVVRKALPGVKLSTFGACPSIVARHVNLHHAEIRPRENDVRDEYLNARQLIECQRQLAPLLDFYTPALAWQWWHWTYATGERYWLFNDRWGNDSPLYEKQRTAMQVWLDVTRHGVQMCRDLLPPKPVIPSAGIQWWPPGEKQGPHHMPVRGELIYPSWAKRMIAELREIADSAMLWIDVEQAGLPPEMYFGSEQWKSVVGDVIETIIP